MQGHAAEQFRLVLVGGEIGHGGKQVGGQGRRGSRIEHHRHPGGTGIPGDGDIDRQGDLQLQHDHVKAADFLPEEGHVRLRQQQVGPGDHHDAVLGAAVAPLEQLHIADGRRRLVGAFYMGHVHARLPGACQHRVPVGVPAHAAHHLHLSAQPGGLDGLIEALAARRGAKAGAQDGLAILRQALGADDQVHHKAAHH